MHSHVVGKFSTEDYSANLDLRIFLTCLQLWLCSCHLPLHQLCHKDRASMDCLPQRPPGRITKQIPHMHEAVARLQELQETDEIEAAQSLLVRMVSIDEASFCSVFQYAQPETLQTPDIMGRTLLHYAAALGKLSALSLLLACDAVDPNARDDAGDTPLHLAAGNGERGTCELLLGHSRVDRTVQDDLGRTALDVAHSAAAHYFATEAVHALARKAVAT